MPEENNPLEMKAIGKLLQQALNEKNELEKPLPSFRQDLQLFQGPDEPDGSPTFNILDPIKNQYYKISWAESLILKHFKSGMSLKDLCHAINTHSSLKVTPQEVKAYFESASRHNLLSIPKPSEKLIQEAELRKTKPLKWIISHYLYIRVPLFEPDAFLKRTLPFVRPLFSKPALMIYLLITFIGMFLLLSRFDEFIHTFPYFFTPQGILTYALALTAVKIVHELSHAYTACHFGVRVPSIGVAFLILWPVLYTDVTDGWKLVKRSHRLWISLAGVISELIIAGICTLGWVVSKPGMTQSVFFVISSATWISTLLMNLNPAMRFDGYYILTDLWGIDNLQSRSFAVARWKLRELFLGIEMPPPERGLSGSRIRGMIIYSIYTWTYRLLLYTTIAFFVYHAFTKSLGIILFSIEIGMFIIRPLISEAQELIHLKGHYKNWKRLAGTTAVFSMLLLWFIIPLPHMQSFPAIPTPIEKQVVYVPYNGVISKIYVKRNQNISKGDPLLEINSEELKNKIENFRLDEKILQERIKVLGLKEESYPFIPEKKKELEAIIARRQALESMEKELTLRSDIKGKLYEWDDSLRENQSISKDQVLGKIGDMKKINVTCFVPESSLSILKVGQQVEFQLKSNHEKVIGSIEYISPTRATTLHYPALASVYKGIIPVKENRSGHLLLIDSYYPVEISLKTEYKDLRIGSVGSVKIKGPYRSKAMETMNYLLSLFWQESGI